ncbi:MAG: hypothetical protein OMM_08054 [Candidatus Magnetoglobus multicellularis str. Araruama]|uniref:Uncharacterized protein n=1 Tax=Candidatus Magnetoglobus multicellularis str. Araruama TaxID=890399 RepID=A0A1V1P9W8_9BACT|nr:MAG: hypothetical protein OMM_08054 [Candidatus Magnetoglobus multicellularis str. Araruama]
MIQMIITISLLIAIMLSIIEYMTLGYVSFFPVIIAFLLIVPMRQMTILTREIDRISKKMLHIKDCHHINKTQPKMACSHEPAIEDKS